MIEQRSPQDIAAFGKLPPTSLLPWLEGILRIIGLWAARSRQRQHLARLDDSALADIGQTRQDVQREITKPFWQK